MNKKGIIVTVVAAVLALGLAAWGGYAFCTRINIKDAELYALIPVYIILLFLGAFCDELIHEGAHLIVGVCCAMGVKPPKIRLFKSSSVDVYPSGCKHLRLRMALTSVAGLFFELLIIALGIISLCVPSVTVLFCVLLPYAFYSFVVNAAPLEYGGGKTDGLVFWELLTNQPTAKVLVAVLKAQGFVHAGGLLQELDENVLFDVPQLPEDDINFIILTQMRYEYYLAKGNDSLAYKYFARYKDLIQYLPEGYTDGEKKKKRTKAEAVEAAAEPTENPAESPVEEAQTPPDQTAEAPAEQSAEAPTEQTPEEKTGDGEE